MFEDVERQIDQTILELEEKSELGDAESQCMLFTFLLTRAMERYDQATFDRAEEVLRRSAASGWPEAIEQLKDQVIRRRAFENRMKRREKP